MLAVELTSLGSPISASYNEIFFFLKNILFSAHKHPRASLVCSVPSP